MDVIKDLESLYTTLKHNTEQYPKVWSIENAEVKDVAKTLALVQGMNRLAAALEQLTEAHKEDKQ
jgi:hypothetical protein